MRETLIEIQRAYGEAAERNQEPTPIELAAVIKSRFPADGPGRERYWRQMGAFVGQAMAGVVIDPTYWDPPS